MELAFFFQALNNLGSVYVDCGKLDLAADCYINALKIRHTRAHQGLARVHYLRNDKAAAYEEMTKLIEKARNNASAYEKRSEYGDRDLTKADLDMVTQLDPLRVYPYRYRAAGTHILQFLISTFFLFLLELGDHYLPYISSHIKHKLFVVRIMLNNNMAHKLELRSFGRCEVLVSRIKD